jgi:hypothetical protein
MAGAWRGNRQSECAVAISIYWIFFTHFASGIFPEGRPEYINLRACLLMRVDCVNSPRYRVILSGIAVRVNSFADCMTSACKRSFFVSGTGASRLFLTCFRNK